MHRRNLLSAAATAAAATFALLRSGGRAQAAAADAGKVAYHLADLDKVMFVLGNIKNHIESTGGPGKVTIVLVVHGPALKSFRVSGVSDEVAQQVAGFLKSGVELDACGNTMRAQNVTLKELLPGFVKVDQGGVVRLAELQAQGFVYLRP